MLTKKDIVIGQEYMVKGERKIAVGPEFGAYCNDSHSHAFRDADASRDYHYYAYRHVEPAPVEIKVGDTVKIVDRTNFSTEVEVGDLAQVTGDNEVRMLTGAVAGFTQVHNTGQVAFVHRKEPTFTPFTIEVNTLEEAEQLKAIMHLHNKVSDSSFFSLPWTPDRNKVRVYMKAVYKFIDTKCPGWSKYGK